VIAPTVHESRGGEMAHTPRGTDQKTSHQPPGERGFLVQGKERDIEQQKRGNSQVNVGFPTRGGKERKNNRHDALS